MTRPFSSKLRREILASAAQDALDVIIIGGGITGAGCLRDAAMRGMKAILLERDDFACATSSQSSKLIHGGLRYLETFDWKLVFEALRERKILLNTAPDFVKPLPFLFPVYRGQRRRLWEIAVGVQLYQMLSCFRNIGSHGVFGKGATLSREPQLRTEGLSGAALYFDAQMQDGRLALAVIQSAWKTGGMAVNHADVTQLIQEDNRVTGVQLTDRIGGENFSIRARWVVNATGPWSDLTRKMFGKDIPPRLRMTKGSHLVISGQRLPLSHAIVMLSPTDGRVSFAIPWEGRTLVGTTDVDYEGDPANVSTSESEVAYLLDMANFYFPSLRLKPKDVLSTFAGLRPLLRDDEFRPSAVSREHSIFSDGAGLITIAGGKYTTFRKMAQEVLDWLIRHTPEWRSRFQPCNTHRTPLHAPIRPSSIAIDIRYLVENEMAVTIADCLARRMNALTLDAKLGREALASVSKALRDILETPEDSIAQQIQEYEAMMVRARSGLRV